MKLCKTISGRIRLYEGKKEKKELCKSMDERIGLYKGMDERTVNYLIFICYFCYYYGHCNCIYI